MANVRITLDVATGRREAIASGFHALLSRSHLNSDWYTIDVVAGPGEVRELLSGRLGTLNDLKRAMEEVL